MRGISWLAAKTGQLLKKDSAAWSKVTPSLDNGIFAWNEPHEQKGTDKFAVCF
jgi:hypothetical protein